MTPEFWRALVAIILTIGVATAIVVLSVLQLIDDGHVTQTESTLLATVLGAAIGAIATYLGLAQRDHDGDRGHNGPAPP